MKKKNNKELIKPSPGIIVLASLLAYMFYVSIISVLVYITIWALKGLFTLLVV